MYDATYRLFTTQRNNPQKRAQKLQELIDKSQKINFAALEWSLDLKTIAKPLYSGSPITNEMMDAICSKIVFTLDSGRKSRAAHFRRFLSSVRGEGGAGQYGKDGKKADDGKSGLSKNANILLLQPNDPDKQTEWTIPRVHPNQCKMLLRKAEGLHYLGDDQSISQARELLDRLIERLAFTEKILPTDALYQAYLSTESDMMIASLPHDANDTAAAAKSAAVTELVSIAKQAQGRLDTIQLGHNYYGFSANFVPALSFKTMKDFLDSSIGLFKSIAEAHSVWDEASKTQAFSEDKLKQAVQHLASLTKQSQASTEQIKNMLQTTSSLIVTLQQQFGELKQAVLQAIQDAADAVRSVFLDLKLEDLVEAGAQLAFSPELPMALIQTVSIAHKGLSQVTDDDGVAIDRKLLITKITTLSGTLKEIEEGITQSKDGNISLDDAGGAKLIIAEKDLEKLLGSYETLLSSDFLKKVKDAFKAYVDVVLKRNAAVFRYNACLQAYATVTRDLAMAEKNVEALKATTFEQSVYYPRNAATIHGFMTQLYNKALDQLMRELFFAQRAYYFMALQEPVNGVLTGGPFSATIVTDLESAVLSLNADLISAYNKFANDPSRFGPKNDVGISTAVVWRLSSEQVDTLKSSATDGKLTMTIPPALPKQTEADNAFAPRANVRVNKVQFFVDGPQIETHKKITVSLTHQGRETIIDPQTGLKKEFAHGEVYAHFQYEWIPTATGNENTTKTASVLSDGSMFDSDTVYALPGPFAEWKIHVHGIDFDRSNITSAWFEFWGYSHFLKDSLQV